MLNLDEGTCAIALNSSPYKNVFENLPRDLHYKVFINFQDHKGTRIDILKSI